MQTIYDLIKEQQIDSLRLVELKLKEKLELIQSYFAARKQLIEEINDKAIEIEGYGNVEAEYDGFKATARVLVMHKFSSGNYNIPESHDVDVDIVSFEMNLE